MRRLAFPGMSRGIHEGPAFFLLGLLLSTVPHHNHQRPYRAPEIWTEAEGRERVSQLALLDVDGGMNHQGNWMPKVPNLTLFHRKEEEL